MSTQKFTSPPESRPVSELINSETVMSPAYLLSTTLEPNAIVMGPQRHVIDVWYPKKQQSTRLNVYRLGEVFSSPLVGIVNINADFRSIAFNKSN